MKPLLFGFAPRLWIFAASLALVFLGNPCAYGQTAAAGKIAFASRRADKNSDIYLMNLDGSGIRRLTYDAAEDLEPSLSPDGTKIAFASSRVSLQANVDSPKTEIYVINVDGSGLTQLTSRAVHSGYPVWSPDGTQIAFTSEDVQEVSGVYTMSATGSNVRFLTEALAYTVSWNATPAGERIGFARDVSRHFQVYTIHKDGTGEELQIEGSIAVYSPDGTKSARFGSFNSTELINVYKASDGSLLQSFAIPIAADNRLVFSADGQKLVFAARDSLDGAFINNHIFSVNLNGTGLVSLTRVPGTNSQTADVDADSFVSCAPGLTVPVAAAPTGLGRLVGADQSGRIYTMNSTGWGVRRLTPSAPGIHPGDHLANPKWSKDGTRIAMDDGTNLFTMAANGSDLRQVTNRGTGYAIQPSYNSAGDRLAYQYVDVTGAIYHERIHVIGVDGSGDVALVNEVRTNTNPDWQPGSTGKVAYIAGVAGTLSGISSADADTQQSLISNALPDGSFDNNFLSGEGVTFSSPAWNPAGTRLALVRAETRIDRSIPDYVRRRDVILINPDGSNPVNITNYPLALAADAIDFLSFSPDGTQLAFLNLGIVATMKSDGTALKHPFGTVRFIDLNWGANFDYATAETQAPLVSFSRPPAQTSPGNLAAAGVVDDSGLFASGPAVVWVALQRLSDGKYWNPAAAGSALGWGTAIARFPGQFGAPDATNPVLRKWKVNATDLPPSALLLDGSYRLTVSALDNAGNASAEISTSFSSITGYVEPLSVPVLKIQSGTVPVSPGAPILFSATETSVTREDLSLHVQYATSLDGAVLWQNLPGVGEGELFGGSSEKEYVLQSSSYPAGRTLYFRVQASAAGTGTVTSNILGPFDLHQPPEYYVADVIRAPAGTSPVNPFTFDAVAMNAQRYVLFSYNPQNASSDRNRPIVYQSADHFIFLTTSVDLPGDLSFASTCISDLAEDGSFYVGGGTTDLATGDKHPVVWHVSADGSNTAIILRNYIPPPGTNVEEGERHEGSINAINSSGLAVGASVIPVKWQLPNTTAVAIDYYLPAVDVDEAGNLLGFKGSAALFNPDGGGAFPQPVFPPGEPLSHFANKLRGGYMIGSNSYAYIHSTATGVFVRLPDPAATIINSEAQYVNAAGDVTGRSYATAQPGLFSSGSVLWQRQGDGSYLETPLPLLTHGGDEDGIDMRQSDLKGISSDSSLLVAHANDPSAVSRYFQNVAVILRREIASATLEAPTDLTLLTDSPPTTSSSFSFSVRQHTAAAGAAIRIQASPNGSSWTNLTGDSALIRSGSILWEGYVTGIPIGTTSFRAVISAPGYTEAFSAPIATSAPVVRGANNTAPSAPDGTANATTGDVKTITLLFPSLDADGDTVTLTGTTPDAHLTVTSVNGHDITFLAAKNYAGMAMLSYTLNDGHGGTATGAISVTIADNDAPTIGGTFSPLAIHAGAIRDYRSQAIKSDNVGVVSVSQSPLPGTLITEATTLVTLTATDAAANHATVSFNVSVTSAPLKVESEVLFGSAAPEAGLQNGPPADALLKSFGVPAVDEDGGVAFIGKWVSAASGNGTGIFTSTRCVAKIGSAVTGLTGATFKTLTDPIAGGGHVAFLATLAGVPKANGAAILSGTPEAPIVIAQSGMAAPGTDSLPLPGGVLFKSFKAVAVDSETVALLAQLGGGSGVAKVNGTNDFGLWLKDATHELTLVLRKGQSIGNRIVKTFVAFTPGAGSPGQGRGWLTQSEGADPRVLALVIFTGKTNTQSVISVGLNNQINVLSESGVAGAQGSPSVNSASFGSYGVPAANSLHTAFLGSLTGGAITKTDAGGLFLDEGNPAYTTIARIGGPAGTTGAAFSVLKDPVLAEDDSIAFPAIIKGGAIRGSAAITLWWKPAGGPLQLLAQGGAHPGGDLSEAQWKSFPSLAITPSGRPLFTATLVAGKGGVTPTTAAGVWATGSNGATQLLFRTGDVIANRTVKSFSLLNATVGSLGVTRSFNDTEVVWLATFTDNSVAVMVTALP